MQANPNDQTSSMTVFLGGLILGVILGLFFASYLVKMGRLSRKSNKAPNLPMAKDFVELVKHNANDGASMRTGSTQSGSDDPHAANETDKFL